MLVHLGVRNLGVIGEASISPSEGFTVITGETGAGKTMLVGGLRLVVGETARSDMVGADGAEATAEALFETELGEVGLSRVIPREGRSRSYRDGQLSSSEAARDWAADSLELIGQHHSVGLRRPTQILSALDSALGDSGREARTRFNDAWADLRRLESIEAQLGGDAGSLRRELDLVRFQHEEIQGADLAEDSDTTAETDASRLRNAEEIRDALAVAWDDLGVGTDSIGSAVGGLRKAVGLDQGLATALDRLEQLQEEVLEARAELRIYLDSVELDPERLAMVESRLTQLGELKRKYGRTMGEVIVFGEQTEARLNELEQSIEAADTLVDDLAMARDAVSGAAESLSDHRKSAASLLQKRTSEHLVDLGLVDAMLEIRFEKAELSAAGADRVELMFAAGPGLEPVSVSKGASGGELSRIALAIHLAMSGPDVTSIVFDEVDAGVGGATALTLGRKIRALADERQVLCVTHLPQVAAFADRHYVIEKVGGRATVREVSGEGRVSEIARMLAGMPGSDSSQRAAEELLSLAR